MSTLDAFRIRQPLVQTVTTNVPRPEEPAPADNPACAAVPNATAAPSS